MKKIIFIIFFFIISFNSLALSKAVILNSSDYNVIFLLYNKGLLENTGENKELLATNKSMNSFEASRLLGEFLLKHLYHPDVNLRKNLSYHDLKNILKTSEKFSDKFDIMFLLNREKISKSVENLKIQTAIAQKEMTGTEFAPMIAEEFPSKNDQKEQPFVSSVKSAFSNNSHQNLRSVENNSYRFERMFSDALMNFYLKNYDEALIKLQKAKFYIKRQTGSISHAKALFWIIRTQIVLKRYDQAEKNIRRFAELKYPSNVSQYDVKDGKNIFTEADDACVHKKDSQWLNYWAGSLYLHNGSSVKKSYKYFKKIIDTHTANTDEVEVNP